MKKRLIRNKKVRYATVAAVLTAMVILVAVLSNVVLSKVVERYSLYTPLTPTFAFDVTEDCYTILEDVFDTCRGQDGTLPEIEVLFCDLEDSVKAEGHENFYLYYTAVALAERFDNVKLKFYDIYINPTPVKLSCYFQNKIAEIDNGALVGEFKIYNATAFIRAIETDTVERLR